MSKINEGITDVVVKLNLGDSDIVANVSFRWYGMHIDNVKVVSNGNEERFLSYPSKATKNGRVFSCRPSKAIAAEIDKAVFEALAIEEAALAKKFNLERKETQ